MHVASDTKALALFVKANAACTVDLSPWDSGYSLQVPWDFAHCDGRRGRSEPLAAVGRNAPPEYAAPCRSFVLDMGACIEKQCRYKNTPA
jgi:hypothetical protein